MSRIMNPKVVSIIESDMCDLFRITPKEMFDLKLEYGINYLENKYNETPDLRNALAHSQAFWTWFRMIWANTDRRLLNNIKVTKWGISYSMPHKQSGEVWTLSKRFTWKEVMELYRFYHKIDVYSAFRPNSIIINKALQELEEVLIKSN